MKPFKMTELHRNLLIAICAKSYRGEPSLCREFDKDWRKHTKDSYSKLVGGRLRTVYLEPRSPLVEDALFDLVRADYIDWFGGGDQGFKPLNYKGTLKGHKWVAARHKKAA